VLESMYGTPTAAARGSRDDGNGGSDGGGGSSRRRRRGGLGGESELDSGSGTGGRDREDGSWLSGMVDKTYASQRVFGLRVKKIKV
jgi:hypothetical protein